jgi:RNA-directed DNA polymerase
VNTDAPWPSLDEAQGRVLEIQTKLHRWATDDSGRRFDDLFNLVCDPAFLLMAWARVKGNKGARSGSGRLDRPLYHRGARRGDVSRRATG